MSDSKKLVTLSATTLGLLMTAMAANKSEVDSAVVFIQGVPAMIRKAAADLAKTYDPPLDDEDNPVLQLASSIEASTSGLHTALTLGTPSEGIGLPGTGNVVVPADLSTAPTPKGDEHPPEIVTDPLPTTASDTGSAGSSTPTVDNAATAAPGAGSAADAGVGSGDAADGSTGADKVADANNGVDSSAKAS